MRTETGVCRSVNISGRQIGAGPCPRRLLLYAACLVLACAHEVLVCPDPWPLLVVLM